MRNIQAFKIHTVQNDNLWLGYLTTETSMSVIKSTNKVFESTYLVLHRLVNHKTMIYSIA